jgi:hypothetical protein
MKLIMTLIMSFALGHVEQPSTALGLEFLGRRLDRGFGVRRLDQK